MQVERTPYRTGSTTEFPLINAVLDGLQDGRLFEDRGKVWYVLHKAGFSYLIRRDRLDLPAIFSFLLNAREIPAYFHLYDPPVQFVDYCAGQGEDVAIRLRKRIQLKFSVRSVKLTDLPLPAGYGIHSIDEANFDQLSLFNLALAERFWRSGPDFLRNGFGFFISNEEGMPVSICYAACVARNTAEIDVATLPGYQKKGLAKAVVSAFTRHCLQHNIVANWHCFEDNQSSLGTAESVGFKQSGKYDFLSIFNKRKQQ